MRQAWPHSGSSGRFPGHPPALLTPQGYLLLLETAASVLPTMACPCGEGTWSESEILAHFLNSL